ncbi:hypothetical protein ACFR9S_14750, partial [Halolamina salina]
VELRLDGDTVTTESVALDAGASSTVEFEVNASELAAGEYNHSVWTEDSEATGDLTIEEEPADSEWYAEYTNDSGVVGDSGVNSAVSDYLGGDLGDTELNQLLNSYLSGDPVDE